MKRAKPRLIPKLIIAGIAVYAAINLLNLQLKINEARRTNEILAEQISAQEKKNAMYSERLEVEIDDAFVSETARKDLGLVAPEDRVFIDVSN